MIKIGHRIALVLCVASCLVNSDSTQAEEWSTFRGDNARTGATSADVPFPVRAVWASRAPAEPRLAWSSAEGRVIEHKLMGHRIRFDDAFRTVVSEGRVYFGSSVDHQLHCLDLDSGKTLWTFFTGGPIRLAPTISDTHLLFGSDDGLVYCLDKRDGTLRWQRKVAPHDEWLLARGEMISKWPVRTGVLVQDGVAFYGAGIFPHEDVFLEGVRVETGERVWRADNISAQDAARDDLSPQGYLLASDHLLFVPSGGSLPAAFDLASGRMVHKRNHSWRTTAGGVVGGTRAVLADGQLYASGPHHFLALDENTGDTGFAWIAGRQMAIDGQQAYVITGTHLARLDRIPYAENSRERQRLELDLYRDQPAYSKAKGTDKIKLGLRIEIAKKRLAEIEKVGIDWEVETSDDMSLLVTARHVIVGGPDRVSVYTKADGAKIAEHVVEGEARGLSVVNDRLLVSTNAGVITCFHSAQQAEASGAAAEPREYLQGGSPDAADQTSDPRLTSQVKQLLERTGIDAGFCLLLGSEQADLAIELARHSDLKIYCVDADQGNVIRSRQRVHEAGLYGRRITVHAWESDQLPYSNYFANLIISESQLRTGELSDRVIEPLKLATRHLKPIGGTIYLEQADTSEQGNTDQALAKISDQELGDQSSRSVLDGYGLLTRGSLPGAGNWSHQYGNADNTAVSRESRVKGDLGVLWYGDPGPDQMVNRHEGAVGPLSVNGRLFIQGESSIMAYDAYNGAHLWTQENPEAIRTGVFQNQNPGNLAAGDEHLFHFIQDKCYQLDMVTGELVATHSLPAVADQGKHQWGYVAIHNGVLYGTATSRKELEAKQRRRGRVTEEATDSIFAIDIDTGKHLWAYEGKSISHHTIAIADDMVFFIDSSLTSEWREELLRQDKRELAGLTGEARELAEQRLKEADKRMAVALDAKHGATIWANPVDVTDCSDIGIGGGKLTLMHADGKLVLCGANANGHYWKQFMAGEFERRRVVVLSAESGYKLWARDANYLHRPIVIGKQLLAEPWMFHLDTGDQITRNHPVTGQPVPWSMMRTGHHCGMVTACDSGMLLFRSGFTGFADLNEDEGIRHFSGHRLGCWINAIAANGLVMIPEAAAGCVCQFSLASTIVLEPRPARRPWTVFSAVGDLTPVEHLAVNLGAPGDRKDALGRIWLSYPRYKPYKQTSLEVELDLKPEFAGDSDAVTIQRSASLFSGGVNAAGFHNLSSDSAPKLESETPWLYHSWADNLSALSLPLLRDEDDPASYTIRLHFAEMREDAPEATSMRVTLLTAEGPREVQADLKRSSSGVLLPLLVEVKDVKVAGSLRIEFATTVGVSFLNAIEAIRETKRN